MQIDRRDDLHIALTPLPSTVRDLGFEKLEDVKAQDRIRDTQDAAQDLAGFVLHEQEDAVGFAAGDFLQDAEEVNGGLELAEGESGYGGERNRGDGMAKLVNRGARGWGVGVVVG